VYPAVENGWLCAHESGTYYRFTEKISSLDGRAEPSWPRTSQRLVPVQLGQTSVEL